jgi:molybdopterin-guanine dinucleotide biosynthesis protein A
MPFDAIILSGGRGSRLGGVSKGALVFAGRSLLACAIDAVSGAERVVIVGQGVEGFLSVREDPPFGGPAAAIAAGTTALGAGSDWVVIVACDVPFLVGAVDALLAAGPPETDGRVAVDSAGIRQLLLGVYRRSSLEAAIASRPVQNLSLRALVSDLELSTVTIADKLLDDIDTPMDAASHRIPLPRPLETS